MTHAFQGCVGNGLCFFAALSKHLVEFRRVFHQLTMASLDGLQCCHGGLCQQWFELAPAHVGAFDGRSLTPLAAEQGIEAEQVMGFRTLRVVEFQPHLRIGLGALDLLGDYFRWIQKRDSAAVVRIAFAHFAATIRQAHHPCPLFEDQRFGDIQHRVFIAAETGVDALLGNVASQFQVLFLVFTDRHQIGVIEKDVRGHQNGIVQKADGNVVTLFDGLFLELDHPLQPIQRRDAVQQPAEFAVGSDLALNEHRTAFGIHAAGQVQRCGASGVSSELRWVMGNCDCMQIDDTDKRVVGVLKINPVADGTQPIAQMQGAGGLHAGENPRPWHQSGLCFC